MKFGLIQFEQKRFKPGCRAMLCSTPTFGKLFRCKSWAWRVMALSKLRQLNQRIVKFQLKWWLNWLLIVFFNPNLSSKSKSSQQNGFKQIRFQSTYSKLIKKDQKSSLFKQKVWNWQILSTFSIDFVFFDWFWPIFNQKWPFWSFNWHLSHLFWSFNWLFDLLMDF